MRSVSESQYDDVVKASGSMLIHFWASWNKNDETVRETLSEMEKSGDLSGITVYQYCVDVSDNHLRCKKMGILNLPYLAYYENGELIRTKTGISDATMIKKLTGVMTPKAADA
jgi:hypothetical protein